MTAQIDDFVLYLDQRYKLIWGHWLEHYIRERYELEKHVNILSTALYRGYVAEYEIKTGQFYLKTLHISASDSELKIGDIQGEVVNLRVKNLTKKTIEHQPMWVKYSPLQERLDASGYIVIAQHAAAEHFPDLHPQSCSKLLGITFVKGQPKTIEDFSNDAARLRMQLGENNRLTKADFELIEALRKKVFKR